MGEVYRARDIKLGREVAVKILPDDVIADPERRARFEREARLLATLNHPHIGAIYGLQDDGDVPALVLELVDGLTLAERIARGPLPIADALDLARQIAEALDAAHENGIVHRDLKPANIKVTPEGKVKVLDFGLAKVMAGSSASSSATDTDVITTTREGVVLGTVAYMSPEQARGKPVDRRTDIWAFGCVLFEMLTGRRAFDGDSGFEVVAHVLERTPDWSALPASTPRAAHRLLEHCLEKDPRLRLRDIADAAGEESKRHGGRCGRVSPQSSFDARRESVSSRHLCSSLPPPPPGACGYVLRRPHPAPRRAPPSSCWSRISITGLVIPCSMGLFNTP